MRRVIFNQKGGVGKSSITVNLAAVSASKGFKTLVVDLDPQCNATQYLLGEVAEYAPDKPELQPNIGQFFAQTLSLKGREKPLLEYVHPTPFENLHVIPSNPELGEIEHLLQSKHKIYKLAAALIASERCLIPFDCDAFSRRALYTLLENVGETRADHNAELEVEGVIVNQFQPRATLPMQLVAELKEEGLPIMQTYLASSVIMKESHQKSMPLVFLSPQHKLSEQYMALFDELADD